MRLIALGLISTVQVHQSRGMESRIMIRMKKDIKMKRKER